jgi:hypothetical protein
MPDIVPWYTDEAPVYGTFSVYNELMAAVPQSEYTLKEMLEAAQAKGFDPSERLLKDWVTLGLLDRATRHSRGYRRGVGRTWPENQLQLFLLLLGKRAEAKRMASLCNIPVALWLWWGDEYVPTRQAQRALATWVGSGRVPWRRAHWTAEQLVAQFEHPEARTSDRNKLVKTLAQAGYSGELDAGKLLSQFRAVFDPHGTKRAVGPPWLNFTAENFLLVTQARLEAVAALRHGDLADDAFEWARREYRESRVEYERLVPNLAADQEASQMFLRQSDGGVVLPPTFEEIFQQSCVDLQTLLGIYHRQQSKGPPQET